MARLEFSLAKLELAFCICTFRIIWPTFLASSSSPSLPGSKSTSSSDYLLAVVFLLRPSSIMAMVSLAKISFSWSSRICWRKFSLVLTLLREQSPRLALVSSLSCEWSLERLSLLFWEGYTVCLTTGKLFGVGCCCSWLTRLLFPPESAARSYRPFSLLYW